MSCHIRGDSALYIEGDFGLGGGFRRCFFFVGAFEPSFGGRPRRVGASASAAALAAACRFSSASFSAAAALLVVCQKARLHQNHFK